MTRSLSRLASESGRVPSTQARRRTLAPTFGPPTGRGIWLGFQLDMLPPHPIYLRETPSDG
jgi:hypothetical protein